MQLENCLRGLGRMQEARDVAKVALRVVERHVEVHPNDSRALYLGAGASLSVGDRDRALQWADRALAVDPEETAVLYNVACTYNLVGERQTTRLTCLRKRFTTASATKSGWRTTRTSLHCAAILAFRP